MNLTWRAYEAAGLMPILSVFDDVMHPQAPHGERGAVAFYEGLLWLLEQPPFQYWWGMYYKPKVPPQDMPFYSDYTWSQETKAVYRRFVEHPRVETLDCQPALTCMGTQACIALAFTSPGTQAIQGGIRTVFFDPLGRFPGSYFERLHPALVATNQDSLRVRLLWWLSMTDSEWHGWLRSVWARDFGGAWPMDSHRRFLEALSS